MRPWGWNWRSELEAEQAVDRRRHGRVGAAPPRPRAGRRGRPTGTRSAPRPRPPPSSGRRGGRPGRRRIAGRSTPSTWAPATNVHPGTGSPPASTAAVVSTTRARVAGSRSGPYPVSMFTAGTSPAAAVRSTPAARASQSTPPPLVERQEHGRHPGDAPTGAQRRGGDEPAGGHPVAECGSGAGAMAPAFVVVRRGDAPIADARSADARVGPSTITPPARCRPRPPGAGRARRRRSGGSPRSTSSACGDSSVPCEPARWGVTTHVGRWSSGWSGGQRLGIGDVEDGGQPPVRTSATRASWSTSDTAGRVDQRGAVHHRAPARARRSCRAVSGRAGACRLTTSQVASSSSRSTRSTPSAAAPAADR